MWYQCHSLTRMKHKSQIELAVERNHLSDDLRWQGTFIAVVTCSNTVKRPIGWRNIYLKNAESTTFVCLIHKHIWMQKNQNIDSLRVHNYLLNDQYTVNPLAWIGYLFSVIMDAHFKFNLILASLYRKRGTVILLWIEYNFFFGELQIP